MEDRVLLPITRMSLDEMNARTGPFIYWGVIFKCGDEIISRWSRQLSFVPPRHIYYHSDEQYIIPEFWWDMRDLRLGWQLVGTLPDPVNGYVVLTFVIE